MTEEQLKKRAEEYAKKIEKELLEDYEPIEYGTTPYLATIPTPHNKQAFIDGYHECQKEHEWHYVKDGLPKESKKYYVYSEELGVEVRKFIADAGCFECRNNIIIAWKEIVLPELPKESE